MEKNFIPYEQGFELKEFGFDEPCFAWYHPKDTSKIIPFQLHGDFKRASELLTNTAQDQYGIVVAPTWDQAFKWFREQENMNYEITVGHDEDRIWWNYYITRIKLGYNYDPINNTDDRNGVDSYEEARLLCLKEMISIVIEELKENPPFGGGNR